MERSRKHFCCRRSSKIITSSRLLCFLPGSEAASITGAGVGSWRPAAARSSAAAIATTTPRSVPFERSISIVSPPFPSLHPSVLLLPLWLRIRFFFKKKKIKPLRHWDSLLRAAELARGRPARPPRDPSSRNKQGRCSFANLVLQFSPFIQLLCLPFS